ncbi:class I SAM-dependent methyltransferase [Methanolacinia paynteri]|uniref:class I SAM-dependent methyltransferase n=1 Tax=Methanolacinia paynteri TaxID=230356 RepID=UPI00064F8D1B|nr:class I SAM-dependent methyltransferase [Methanolacinia paynteri]
MKDNIYLDQKKCILCGNPINNCIELLSLNEDQTLLKCPVCGLIFNNKMRIDFDVIYGKNYYEVDNVKDQCGGYFNYSSIEIGLNKDYYFAYKYILNKSRDKKNFKLLDIGCGYGFFLKQFLADNNIILEGIETSSYAASVAEKSIPKIYDKPLGEINLEKKSYDAVLMFEVIEHLINPFEYLQKINELLIDGGYLIISTPNISNITFKLLKKKWPAIHPETHNIYYTPKTLVKICEENGFELVSLQQKNTLRKSVNHISRKISMKIPQTSIIFKPLKVIDDMIIPFPSGGSINAIFRKKEII